MVIAPSRNLIDPASPLVADASAVISLIASGAARKIAEALPVRLRIVTAVAYELEKGRQRGWATSDHLSSLITDGLVDVVELSDDAGDHFEALVVGSAADTLDDGEAATIAYAHVHGATALIDERKGLRICTRRFPGLRVATTVDLLTSSLVKGVLGVTHAADATFGALKDGRMRVLPEDIERVIEMIGAARASLCSSLPARVRRACLG